MITGYGGEKYKGFTVDSFEYSLERIMPEILSNNPDLIILAVHHGIYTSKRLSKGNNIRTIANKYPQIDLILGGHSHQIYAGNKISRNTLFVEPGRYGEYLSKITVEFDSRNEPKIETELIPVNDDANHDFEILQLSENLLKETKKLKETFIGNSESYISDIGVPGIDCQISEILCKSILESGKADISMCGVIKENRGLPNTVFYDDIFQVTPYEDTIGILHLTLRELSSIIEEQLNFSDKYMKHLGIYGIFVYHNKDNEILYFKDINNKILDINSEERYSVAFSSYDIAGAGNRFPVLKGIAELDEVNAKDTEILVRESLVNYIKKNRHINIKPTKFFNIID